MLLELVPIHRLTAQTYVTGGWSAQGYDGNRGSRGGARQSHGQPSVSRGNLETDVHPFATAHVADVACVCLCEMGGEKRKTVRVRV